MNTDLHSLVAAYALDALTADERIEFEAHLETCDDCRRDLDDFVEIAADLADATSVAPPASLRGNVMSQLDGVDQVPPVESEAAPVVRLDLRRLRRPSVPALLAAAAAVALIAVGAIVISVNRGGADFDDVVNASDAVVTVLDGESGFVEVAYSPSRDQVALRAENVVDLGSQLRYALWAIADGTAIPAGLFEAEDGMISDVVGLDDVAADVWAITIESASGSEAPTSEPIFVGEV